MLFIDESLEIAPEHCEFNGKPVFNPSIKLEAPKEPLNDIGNRQNHILSINSKL